MEIRNNTCKVNVDHMSPKEIAEAKTLGNNVNVIICLSSQKKYDLFLNEMQGQISDGMWENSRNTTWLWSRDVMVCMGDVDKVIVHSSWCVGKKNFRWCSGLNVIAGRATEESGFSCEAEMKKAWNEIAAAIANPVIDQALISSINKARYETNSVLLKEVADRMLPKLIQAVSEKGEVKRSYASPDFCNERATIEIKLLPRYAEGDAALAYKAAVTVTYTYYAKGAETVTITMDAQSSHRCELKCTPDAFFSGAFDKAMEMAEIMYWFHQQDAKKSKK